MGLAVGSILAALAVAGIAVLVVPHIEGTIDPRPTVVRVVTVAGSYFYCSHVVELPDGTEADMTAREIYPAGTFLRARVARGRYSGKVVVIGPYEVLDETDVLLLEGWPTGR